ncbi:hypothetical protein AMATHDRAFT_81705 [Amanita thiersii Skay4041]|uniref:Polyketide synthase-like phosphopantetheine-binding domain-containing protein n=1 Tax=Amanita thiersii Skay4041 TaxID=703135 RepID=A0A2A9NK16_9AGAR|nr:hypothetical protein AMATHDRAFT_81705 [Amanita thiersii Skay4041]
MSPVLSASTFVRPYINLGYGNDHPEGVNTLPELIEFVAKHNPDHLFGLQARSQSCPDSDPDTTNIIADTEPTCHLDLSDTSCVSLHEITFSQFGHVVKRACAWLINSGATPGRAKRTEKVNPVAILLSSDITIFVYLAALLRIGTPAFILSPRLPPLSIVHLLTQTQTLTVLANTHHLRMPKNPNPLFPSTTFADQQANFIIPPSYFDLASPSPTNSHLDTLIPPAYTESKYSDLDAILLHTSGTTGAPKPVYQAHAYVLLYATCHKLPPQHEPFRFNVSTLPLYHGFGLLAPCLSLSIGMPFVLLPSSTIPTGRSALTALQSTGARYMLTVPSIVEDILRLTAAPHTSNKDDKDNDDNLAILRQLEILAIGGAPMKEFTTRELVKAGVNLLNHWGTTELGPIAPIQRPPPRYDQRYIIPRTDLNLQFIPLTNDTFHLIGKAPGWAYPHIVQDLLLSNPNSQHAHTQFLILGRADDLIILGTGEKVRPGALEREVANHPCVKDVLAFGDGRCEVGLVVELVKGCDDVHPCVNLDRGEDVKRRVIEELGLEEYIERGNEYVEGYAKVSKEMVVLTREDVKPLKRTDKGSLARKENYLIFEKEIRRCYEAVEGIKQRAEKLPLPRSIVELNRVVRRLVRDVGVGPGEQEQEEQDRLDLFEMGMDSLQAARLRREVLDRLSAIDGVLVGEVPSDFVYLHPTVEKLSRALYSILGGEPPLKMIQQKQLSKQVKSKEEQRIAAMEAMVDKYRQILAEFSSLLEEQERTDDKGGSRRLDAFTESAGREEKVVLLTGSTGSLGCCLLARLVKDPNVIRVVCLNRPARGYKDLRAKQRDQLAKRNMWLTTLEWSKVVLHECDMGQDRLGLGRRAWKDLGGVTHVVHCAWPVDFSRTLDSFEAHVRGLVEIVRVVVVLLWGEAPVRLTFVSSIAAVGRYPLVSHQVSDGVCGAGGQEVPECPLGSENVTEMGYAEAKWVCEKLVEEATRLFGGRVRGSCVRVGQMTGPDGGGGEGGGERDGVGVWNENEHVPVLTLSWMPVDKAASSIVELLFSTQYSPIYHVENPVRQSWKGMVQTLASILRERNAKLEQHGNGQDNMYMDLEMVNYQEWLGRIYRLGTTLEANGTSSYHGRDPAVDLKLTRTATNVDSPLLSFFENDFVRLAAGGVVLSTVNARRDSMTMEQGCREIGRRELERFVMYWESVGAI